jgi:hypothetical protein
MITSAPSARHTETELAKASTWERGDIIEKSGFAVMPGSKTGDSDIARACADILLKLVTPKT